MEYWKALVFFGAAVLIGIAVALIVISVAMWQSGAIEQSQLLIGASLAYTAA